MIQNKGKVENRIVDFFFDLYGLRVGDEAEPDPRWGGQTNFPELLVDGAFQPDDFEYFAVGPGVTARYSFVADIPDDVAFVMLHCRFKYMDRPNFAHSMERTAKVPTAPNAISHQPEGFG